MVTAFSFSLQARHHLLTTALVKVYFICIFTSIDYYPSAPSPISNRRCAMIFMLQLWFVIPWILLNYLLTDLVICEAKPVRIAVYLNNCLVFDVIIDPTTTGHFNICIEVQVGSPKRSMLQLFYHWLVCCRCPLLGFDLHDLRQSTKKVQYRAVLVVCGVMYNYSTGTCTVSVVRDNKALSETL